MFAGYKQNGWNEPTRLAFAACYCAAHSIMRFSYIDGQINESGLNLNSVRYHHE